MKLTGDKTRQQDKKNATKSGLRLVSRASPPLWPRDFVIIIALLSISPTVDGTTRCVQWESPFSVNSGRIVEK